MAVMSTLLRRTERMVVGAGGGGILRFRGRGQQRERSRGLSAMEVQFMRVMSLSTSCGKFLG